jgi:UDP-N-acetylglucosamine 4,6-dehydratase/5-epimerase
MAIRDFKPTNLSLDDKSILITGGTGSFGRQLTKVILQRYKPRRLIIFSRDELKQYEMAQVFSPAEHPCLRYFIGDVRDRDRLAMAMREVDVVFHAAALKQVPAAEYNPFECIRTNVIGAENVVQAAFQNRVPKVVALSTDKAANPINLYGASKLASDKIFVAANNMSGSLGTRFSVVRYGNVVGSRGSIVPLFQRLIAEGVDTLPITDERMTRFWITVQHGVNFVLSSLEMMVGGEIFIPKIPSMKVVDVAEAMAPGLPHKIIGIRPGEKLHEVMLTDDDARNSVELEDRYVIEPIFSFWDSSTYRQHGSKELPEGFSYTSDRNHEWLDGDSLLQMIAESPKD